MDTKTTLLYATLPVWNTVFSLISKSTLGEIGAKSYTATVLMITAILSLFYNYFSGVKTKINLYSILAGCSFGIATLFFEEAVHIAKNPGIVNGLYRSQAALTAVVSVFLLGSHLSYTSMLGVILTVMGAFVIGLYKRKHITEPYEPGIIERLVDEKNKRDEIKEKEKTIEERGAHERSKWLPLVLIAGVLATIKDISAVYSVRGGKMKPSSFVFSQCFFGALMVMLYQYFTSGNLLPELRKDGNWKDAAIGITTAGLDNFLWCGVLIYLMSNARNPAYPKAVTMLGIPLTALVAPFLFDVKFPDSTQWGGIASVVAGIGLLAL